MKSDALLTEAIAALQMKDKVRARELLQTVVAQDPQNDKAWMYLGVAAENRRQAIACLERATQINPANDQAWTWLKKLEAQTPKANQAKPNFLVFALIGVSVLLIVVLASIGTLYAKGYFNMAAPTLITPLAGNPVTQVTPTQAATSPASISTAPMRDLPPTWTPTPRPAPTPRPPLKPTSTPRPTATPKPDFAAVTQTLGPIYNSSHDERFSVEITVQNVEWRARDGYSEAKPGYVYVLVSLNIKNLGPGPIRSLSSYDFQTLDTNGALRNNTYLVNNCDMDLVDLLSGGQITGCIAFEVPTEGQVEFIYAPYQYEGLVPGRYISVMLRP